MDHSLPIEQTYFSEPAVTYKSNLQNTEIFFGKFAISFWSQMLKSFQLQEAPDLPTRGSAPGPHAKNGQIFLMFLFEKFFQVSALAAYF